MNYGISQGFDLSKEVKDLEYKRYDKDKLINKVSFKLSEAPVNCIKNYLEDNRSIKHKISVNIFIRNLILNYIDLIERKNIHYKVNSLPRDSSVNTGKQYTISFLLTNQQWRILRTRQIEIGAKNVNILIKNVILNWIKKENK